MTTILIFIILLEKPIPLGLVWVKMQVIVGSIRPQAMCFDNVKGNLHFSVEHLTAGYQ